MDGSCTLQEVSPGREKWSWTQRNELDGSLHSGGGGGGRGGCSRWENSRTKRVRTKKTRIQGGHWPCCSRGVLQEAAGADFDRCRALKAGWCSRDVMLLVIGHCCRL